MAKTQKLYCYVDETGQDVGSSFFVVVCIVSSVEQNQIRDKLLKVESSSKVHARKWFNSRSPIKEEFLQAVMNRQLAKGDIYYGKFKKPILYFWAVAKTIEKAIKTKSDGKVYKAIVYVDGIDKKRAIALTSTLRKRGVSLKLARSVRDESEPMIRLADRWAGFIRDALEGKEISMRILLTAEKDSYIKRL